jgi:hypothetical protein
MWEAMRDAKIFEKGEPPAVGLFDLVVSRAFVKDTFEYGTAFICEMEVFNSTNPSEQPEGSTCNFYQGLQHKGAAMSAIKAFVINLLGYDFPKDKARIETEFDPIADRFMTAATSPQNPLAGLFIHCESYLVQFKKPSKKGKTSGTNQKWSAFDYEGNGIERPNVHELLAKAASYTGGQIVSPMTGAAPPAGIVVPPPGATIPPGALFYPEGKWPGGGATHWRLPSVATWTPIG